MRRIIFECTTGLIIFTIFTTLLLFDSNDESTIDDLEIPPKLKFIQGNSNQTYKSLVVTAYINLGRTAKHSQENYNDWISIISNIESPMVIYTDVIHKIEPYRKNKPTLFVATSLKRLQKMGGMDDQTVRLQSFIDPQGRWHTPYLYVVWDAKHRLVYEASEKYNYWNCEYFFWTDIGSFRTNYSLKYWPDPDRVDKAFQGENRTLYAAVGWPTRYMNNYQEDFGPFISRFIEGTFFGGNKFAIKNVFHKYYELKKKYMQKGSFIGNDQPIMSSLILSNKKDFLVLNSTDIPCMDSWFFFQQYFASDAESLDQCQPNRLLPTIYLDKNTD